MKRLTADGEPITWASQGSGHVLAAEFVNGGKTHQAVWYRDADGRGSYFDFQGQSMRRTFLASPMEFSRVSSGFAMRFHPILQAWRAHLGVDYAAPTGTAGALGWRRCGGICGSTEWLRQRHSGQAHE